MSAQNPFNIQPSPGFSNQQYTPYSGLPSGGNLSTSTQAAQYNPISSGGSVWSGNAMNGGEMISPSRTSTTYNGPGGQFQNISGSPAYGGTNGAWRGAGGQMISDLPGYLSMRQQQQQGANFQPYEQQLQGLLNDPSKIQQTPGYQFAVDQGNQAINRSAAAKGMLGSGNVLAELAKYGQGMGSQEYGNQVNRLSDLMHGAQQFGIQSGMYAPNPYGIFSSGVGSQLPPANLMPQTQFA